MPTCKATMVILVKYIPFHGVLAAINSFHWHWSQVYQFLLQPNFGLSEEDEIQWSFQDELNLQKSRMNELPSNKHFDLADFPRPKDMYAEFFPYMERGAKVETLHDAQAIISAVMALNGLTEPLLTQAAAQVRTGKIKSANRTVYVKILLFPYS